MSFTTNTQTILLSWPISSAVTKLQHRISTLKLFPQSWREIMSLWISIFGTQSYVIYYYHQEIEEGIWFAGSSWPAYHWMVTYIGDITEIESRIHCMIAVFYLLLNMCYSDIARHELHGDAETVRLRCSEMWFHTLVCSATCSSLSTCSMHGRPGTVLKSDTALPNLSELAGKPF